MRRLRAARVAAALAWILVFVASGCAPALSQQRGVERDPAGQEFARGERLGSVREALSVSALLAGGPGPASVNWIDGGERFSFTARGAEGRAEVRRYDPAALTDQLLFDPRRLTLDDRPEPLEYESFQWARDSGHLLFQANFRPIYRHSGVADFYLYSLTEERLELVAADARTAELSPDGRLVGFERGGDVFMADVGDRRERRLTTGGSDTIFNGVFDWVYEEEFGLTQAWSWSPDSRRIAYWQTDERGVPVVRLTDYREQHPEWVEIAYPKVGDTNPRVRIGVVDVVSGENRWLDVGLAEEHYIPRIYWTSEPNTLAVVTLNRPQNHLQLHFFDVRTGQRRLVMEERSAGWIDVFDFFARVDHFFHFPEGLREFFWISDRDGHQHIYRYSYDGDLLNQVTAGPWAVTRVEGIDVSARTIYYTSTEASVLERHLYAVGFDGGGRRRVTRARGTHQIDMSPNGRYFIDRWSNTETPRQVELWTTEDGGRRLSTLEDNAAVRAHVRGHAYSPLELFSFTTADGVRLDGSMIRPPDFDPSRRYPVVLSIYGGPGSQQVYDAWTSNGWHQYLAQEGYIIVGLNNRGSGNYGRDFMETVYRRLGEVEARDFAAVAGHLRSLPYVDAERMAIQGTSYGGYMAVYTMLRHPGEFVLGISNSPVTDWRLYDTIYTERYMGLLGDNLTGYERSSVFPYVDRLSGHLLLVHSAMDENVHPQHTMQLLTALASAGKDAELRFYPPGGHGAAFDANSYVSMTEVYTNLLCRHIAPSCTPATLNR